MHRRGSGDCPTAFAGVKALECFGLLVLRELGLTAEPGAALAGSRAAIVGSLDDPVALVLSRGGQEGNKPRLRGVVRSKCGLSRTLIRAPRALMRSMRWMPSNIERVARSHSATTMMS